MNEKEEVERLTKMFMDLNEKYKDNAIFDDLNDISLAIASIFEHLNNEYVIIKKENLKEICKEFFRQGIEFDGFNTKNDPSFDNVFENIWEELWKKEKEGEHTG